MSIPKSISLSQHPRLANTMRFNAIPEIIQSQGVNGKVKRNTANSTSRYATIADNGTVGSSGAITFTQRVFLTITAVAICDALAIGEFTLEEGGVDITTNENDAGADANGWNIHHWGYLGYYEPGTYTFTVMNRSGGGRDVTSIIFSVHALQV